MSKFTRKCKLSSIIYFSITLTLLKSKESHYEQSYTILFKNIARIFK